MLCFPAIGLDYLGGFPESDNLLPREPLSGRQVHEFQRTAELVGKEHWALHRAAKYLRVLFSNDAQGYAETWVPPDIGWVFKCAIDTSGCALCIDDAEYDVLDVSFALTKPVPVHMRGGNIAKAEVVPGARRSNPLRKKLRAASDGTSAKGTPSWSDALEQGQAEGSCIVKQPKRVRMYKKQPPPKAPAAPTELCY